MRRSQHNAKLFLNGSEVGTVKVTAWDDSWGFGEFSPGEAFSPYAQHFGTWSLLIHADGRLSRAAAEELRRVEYDIDRIRARLFLEDQREWRKITQLNIDGPLIEWKEDFCAERLAGAA